jgi:hypothetical protein
MRRWYSSKGLLDRPPVTAPTPRSPNRMLEDVAVGQPTAGANPGRGVDGLTGGRRAA